MIVSDRFARLVLGVRLNSLFHSDAVEMIDGIATRMAIGSNVSRRIVSIGNHLAEDVQ